MDVGGMFNKFTDDQKIARVIDSVEGSFMLHSEVDQLVK